MHADELWARGRRGGGGGGGRVGGANEAQGGGFAMQGRWVGGPRVGDWQGKKGESRDARNWNKSSALHRRQHSKARYNVTGRAVNQWQTAGQGRGGVGRGGAGWSRAGPIAAAAAEAANSLYLGS